MNDPEGSIGVGEGAIWVVTEEDDHKYLTRFNAGTGAEEAKISLPGGIGVVVDYGYVWVTDEKEGELYRIDPRTNSIASATPLHGNPRFITSGEGSVWVLNQSDGTVQRVDGRTGEVAATIETGGPGGRPGRTAATSRPAAGTCGWRCRECRWRRSTQGPTRWSAGSPASAWATPSASGRARSGSREPSIHRIRRTGLN